MVIDSIKNASLYYGLGAGIEAALKLLEEKDFSDMTPGRYDMMGKYGYVLVSDVETSPISHKRWEAHRNYIDVQFIAKGAEIMGCTDISELKVDDKYSDEKDIVWLKGKGTFFDMREGMFAIFYPHDAHMPGVAEDQPTLVRKVVVKVAVSDDK